MLNQKSFKFFFSTQIFNIYNSISSCRICNNTNLVSIIKLGRQCLTGVFPKDRSEKVTSGPVDLVKCHGKGACGLVQLKQSYDLKEMYGLNYGYRSGLNLSMVHHLKLLYRAVMVMVQGQTPAVHKPPASCCHSPAAHKPPACCCHFQYA